MPKELPGFKGLILSYLKANAEIYSIPEIFTVDILNHNAEDGTWKASLNIPGEHHYRRIELDTEDLMGFMWDRISMIGTVE